MTREEVLNGIQTRFGDRILDFFEKSAKRVYIDLAPVDIMPVASHLFRELGARFHIASGVDTRFHLEVLYHFSVETLNLLVTLRVRLDKKAPRVDSLAPLIKGAAWIEREMHELLGIDFAGHPDLRRLLLSEEWPEGVYPLRQDYQEWDAEAIRDRGA
jgi:NADH-quinone oxidoreductase subunit C